MWNLNNVISTHIILVSRGKGMSYQEEIISPHLDPLQLYEKRRTKDIYRLKTYNKILDQIYHRILTISKLPNSPAYLLFSIPCFILGMPRVDQEDCAVFLIHQLRHAKYSVQFTYPNLLLVSWVHHERSYLTSQSPILQTMLQSYEKTQEEQEASRILYAKKSQRKVKIADPTQFHQKPAIRSAMKPQGVPMTAIKNVLGSYPPNGLNPVAAPPVVSAAEYQPPSSFLQNIMNPKNNVTKPQTTVDYLR